MAATGGKALYSKAYQGQHRRSPHSPKPKRGLKDRALSAAALATTAPPTAWPWTLTLTLPRALTGEGIGTDVAEGSFHRIGLARPSP